VAPPAGEAGHELVPVPELEEWRSPGALSLWVPVSGQSVRRLVEVVRQERVAELVLVWERVRPPALVRR